MPNVRLTISLPDAAHKKIAKLAKNDGRTISNYVQRVIEQHLKDIKPKL